MSSALTGSQDRPAVDIALLIVRVIVGIIFVAHGAQKFFGVFGGPGLAAMVQPPPGGMGLLGYPVTIGEFFGGLGLIVGFLCRFSAASLIVIMGPSAWFMVSTGSFSVTPQPTRSPLPASNTTWPSLGCWPRS